MPELLGRYGYETMVMLIYAMLTTVFLESRHEENMASRLSCKQRVLGERRLDPIRHFYQKPVYHSLGLTTHTAGVCLGQGFVSLCTTIMRIGIENRVAEKRYSKQIQKIYEQANSFYLVLPSDVRIV